uniref:PHD-type domain-containing protein n=1 Tax=Caenorhabditis japonica TaxID=281687 RepID=A0A8R1DLQ4_CAEJA
MSTSFPNNNGNVPPYNPQANGSYNQFGQSAQPGGSYPGIEQFQHNMYAPPNANGFGGMLPVQPQSNIGGPQQQPPGGQNGPQYPGTGAGMKLPGYDAMQNGYMGGYPPTRPGLNGAPPNYNGHPNMPPNPYGGVTDPYRVYPGMPGPPQQTPPGSDANQAQPTPPAPQRPPSQQQHAQPSTSASQQYPAQQALPAQLHPGGGPQYSMPQQPAGSARGNVPLQHYQPPNFMNQPTRTPSATNLLPLQSPNGPKTPTKNEAETRSNNFGGGFPNHQYQPYGGPGCSGTPGSYPPYGGYPGFGPPPGSKLNGTGPSGRSGTPGSNNGQTIPSGGTGNSGGFNSGFDGIPSSDQNTPSTSAPSPFVQNPQSFGSNGSHPGQFGGPSHPGSFGGNTPGGNDGSTGGATGANDTAGGRGTPGTSTFGTTGHSTPGTPGTPGAHGPLGNVPLAQSPLAQHPSLQTPPPQQQAAQSGPGQQHQMPHPMYAQNSLMSPNHGSNNMKPHARSPMGSSLPLLNGQYPSPMTLEPTFKEPTMPVRQSPSHPPPLQPPSYHQPCTSKPEQQLSLNGAAPRAHSPTFAVPTLPAAATLAHASSNNQFSTKPRASPQKKKSDENVTEPPNADTPFTMINHYELPALASLRETLSSYFQKAHPQLDKYFSRKRQQLRVPYPEGAHANTAPVLEPDTFGFMQGTKYFQAKYHRGIPITWGPTMGPPMGAPMGVPLGAPLGPPMGPPALNRSQSMHTPLVSPGYNNVQQVSSNSRQPAKKARSASDASEPGFNVPLPPSRGGARQQNDPRLMQQMQMHYQQQQMQKMHQHQQQQMAAHQQHMARMAQGGAPGSMSPASGGSGAPGPSGQLPPLAPPSLQRAESMPQLPSQQGPGVSPMGTLPPLGGQSMSGPPMGGPLMPGMNESAATKGPLTPTSNTGLSNGTHGHPHQSLQSLEQDGRLSDYSEPSTSNQAPPVLCAGCHLIVMRGSATLCCMYHECKNVYHRECTRLSLSAFNHFEQETPHARWVCPTCEPQVRQVPPQMQMQHA